MKFTWMGLLLEIIVFSFLKNYILNFEVLSIFFIIISFIFFIVDIYKYEFEIRNIIFIAYVIRLLAMFWDIYARHIFNFPGSGKDTEAFLRIGLDIYKNISLLFQLASRGLYSNTLGAIFYGIIPHRLIGQYINVLFGVSIVVILYKILVMMEINETTIRYSILIITFLPNAIINSAILLRENITVFFALVSFYYFVKWYKFENNKYVVYSLITLLISSAYHSGVIGLAFGYIFMYLFYNHNKNKFVFSRNTILIFSMIIIISTAIYVNYYDFFFGKFANIEEVSDIYGVASARIGGSQYLTGISINNFWQLILYSPIYMFYFLTSPLPMDWRGFGDILAFSIDGIFYIYFLFYSVYFSRKYRFKNYIFIGTIISILATVFIFGVGVQNAGTAMRHRHKIVPIIIIAYAMVQDYKFKRRIDNNI